MGVKMNKVGGKGGLSLLYLSEILHQLVGQVAHQFYPVHRDLPLHCSKGGGSLLQNDLLWLLRMEDTVGEPCYHLGFRIAEVIEICTRPSSWRSRQTLLQRNHPSFRLPSLPLSKGVGALPFSDSLEFWMCSDGSICACCPEPLSASSQNSPPLHPRLRRACHDTS